MTMTASEMAKKLAESMTPEQRKERASKAGKAYWNSLSEEQRKEKISLMVQSRKKLIQP